ncbi:MAG: hydrogenase nickel incorporation protein HypB [Pseudobdellovibrionaceae bacterium]
MCKDCGCLTATHPIFSEQHPHLHADTHTHEHSHLHQHEELHDHSRKIKVEETLFMQNQKFAEQNRHFFKKQNLTVFNVMSSPGSGKTTLLAKILPGLAKKHPLAVIVGDQETDIDSSRLSAAGLTSFQINTHSACHLDAHRVGHAVEHLPLATLDWIVIENVGNLVCPAVFDLGESIKVALLSTPEGEEKPLKYPVLFHDANLIVITKSDLIPHLDFNKNLLLQNIRSLNPSAPVIFCSVKTGEGLTDLALALETVSQTLGDNHVPRHTSQNLSN